LKGTQIPNEEDDMTSNGTPRAGYGWECHPATLGSTPGKRTVKVSLRCANRRAPISVEAKEEIGAS